MTERLLKTLDGRWARDQRMPRAACSNPLKSQLAARKTGFGTVQDLTSDPTGDAVQRFLKWEHDPKRRDAALACALPRRVDEDIVAVLTSPEDAAGLLSWLHDQPFVTDQGGRYQYHTVVRDLMLRTQRGRSRQAWRCGDGWTRYAVTVPAG